MYQAFRRAEHRARPIWCCSRGLLEIGGVRVVVEEHAPVSLLDPNAPLRDSGIRWLGEIVPVGQIVFFRSAFALLPVVLMFIWQGQLWAAIYTNRPFGQLWRGTISVAGMFLNFAALARLPLVDATAISFAAPLITVAGPHCDPVQVRIEIVGTVPPFDRS